MRYLEIAACLTGIWVADVAQAQAPLDRLEAGRQSYARQEAARREQLDRQRDLPEYLRWQAALPDRRLYYSGPGAAGYGYSAVGPMPRTAGPAGGVSVYEPALSPVRPGLTGPWFIDDGVFEPWPVWPGQIFGYRYDNPVEQPTGHEIIWHGPNSYTYQPTYAPRGLPVAAAPVAPRTIDWQRSQPATDPGGDLPGAASGRAPVEGAEPANNRPVNRQAPDRLPRPARLVEDEAGPREF